MTETTKRYQVRYFCDADLQETGRLQEQDRAHEYHDDIAAAQDAAAGLSSSYGFGTAVLDRQTGKVFDGSELI